MEVLKESRRLKRTDATKTCNTVQEQLSSLSLIEKSKYKTHLQNLLSKLEELDSQILTQLCNGIESKKGDDLLAAQKVHDAEYEKSSEYSLKILDALAGLENSISSPPATPRSNPPPTNNFAKLPLISLPTFGNKDGEDLTKFFQNFELIIDKYNLSDYEKLTYLQDQLSGEPLDLIGSLELDSQNYASAKSLLEKGFASKSTQKFNLIERLTKLQFKASESPFKYIREFRLVIEAIRRQKITIDEVLQYFVWQGMNFPMQQHLIHITNNNKPTVAEIEEHIFEATERYKDFSKKSKSHREASYANRDFKSEQTINATAVDSSKPILPYCSLCSTKENKDSTHSTAKCEKYPDVKSKIDKLKSANGCLKCASLSHPTQGCKRRFQKKCHCQKFHYSFICPNSIKGVSVKSVKVSPEEGETSLETGTVFVGKIKTEHYGEDAIIPTFSINVKNTTIRCMRDSGCQPNFIRQELAKSLKLKVIQKDFPLKINGFVSSETSPHNVVEVPVSRGSPPVLAICIPKIRTSIRLPGLRKVVQGFVDKGYHLADKTLAQATDDHIGNLDFILGNNDAHILPQRDILFGDAPSSVYSVTPMGICLVGGVGRLLRNMPSLPENPKKNKSKPKNRKNQRKQKPAHPVDAMKTSLQSENIEKAFELCSMEVSIDTHGLVDPSTLEFASDEVMRCTKINNLHYDDELYNDKNKEVDQRLTNFVIESTERDAEGKLVMPILWHEQASHLLGNNKNLSLSILKTNLKKLERNPEKLAMYDGVIKEQAEAGIIEKIENLPEYLKEHPNSSFLPHMGVFRPENETTKCRVVMLSNLKEGGNENHISHNQAMLSGPNLNHKISTALNKIRFDKFLFSFDIKKAFHCIKIFDIDSDKLLIHWFKNVNKSDFSIVGYKFKRLPFGLRCSPAILMLALFKILILDSDENDPFKNEKEKIFDLMYMDNGFVTSNDEEELSELKNKLPSFFNPYGFELQKMYSNSTVIQGNLDEFLDQETPQVVKLLGFLYDRINDTLSTVPLYLNPDANTKRMILSSIASNYDILQISGPVLNRARLFAHALQCSPTLGWNDRLSDDLCRNWARICKQLNGSPLLSIHRFVGVRTNRYALLCFADASKVMLGCVVYVRDSVTGQVSFVLAKNRIIGGNLIGKSIPSLELHALSLGVDTLMDVYRDLAGEKSVVPIKIEQLLCYSDSMVALNWLNNSTNKLAKMQTKSPFIINRLESIEKACDTQPVHFNFIAGEENPADLITRPVSAKTVQASCYLTGPSFASKIDFKSESGGLSFVVPNPSITFSETIGEGVECCPAVLDNTPTNHLFPLDKFSSLRKTIRVMTLVLKFIQKLKSKCFRKRGEGGHPLQPTEKPSVYKESMNRIIKIEQKLNFPEELSYLKSKQKMPSKLPPLIGKLNIFLDDMGILRVRTKFRSWEANATKQFPILLAKNSLLTKLIVENIHLSAMHAGLYTVLTYFRKSFYVPQVYSQIKKVLKECLVCRRFNERTIQLNQSYYRDFRSAPAETPFRNLYIDHFGPYSVKIAGKTVKVWILCICCLWSRAISLKISYDMTVKEFLRVLQLHILENGCPEKIFSDAGSQIVAGANIIRDMVKDYAAKEFFDEHGIRVTQFVHHPKGNKALGSLVESCVKLSKRLISKSIQRNILDILQFEVIISQAIHYVNKRPIAFKSFLRNSDVNEEIPEPITPELLIKGYDTMALNILPEREMECWNPDNSKSEKIAQEYEKLTRIRNQLKEMYHDEFQDTLWNQAGDKQNRFKPVTHRELAKGDIVLLKDEFVKVIDYPMATVIEVIPNCLGETTEVTVRKGNTREIVRRHVTSVIPYFKVEGYCPVSHKDEEAQNTNTNNQNERPKRRAAIDSAQRTKTLLQDE